MAKKVWDFDCPQYIDFERELDNSGKDDIFFESTFYEEEMRYVHSETKTSWRRFAGVNRYAEEINIKDESKDKSPKSGSLCTPEVQGKGKGLTDSDENKLLDKMTAALSLLENTPKIKKSASRGKLFPESVFKIPKKKKAYTVPAPPPRSRRSKSLENISENKSKKKKYGLRKSSSLNDLRTHNKMKYPVTPMCLKRTIFKAKEKVCKTTEEMELEQIAGLQKQLIQHLRQNEISLKKLNLRPRQCTAPKILPKADNLKNIKGAGTLAEKSNAAEKKPRRSIRLLSQAAVRKEASKLDTIINHETVSSVKTDNAAGPRKSKAYSVARKEASKLVTTVKNEAASSRNTIYSRKTKTLSVPAAVSDAINNTAQKTKKLTHKKIVDHSGLMFIPTWKSNAVKPFIFEEKPQTTGAKQKETPALNLKENNDKENKGPIRPQFSSKKSQGTQNAKCDINKLDESKTAGKRTTNPLRGVPLAENVARD